MELTTEQQAAVESDAQNTLVVAPAGAGKTRVLVARVVHLLAQGAPPESILVLTFTRRAAREALNRIKAEVQDEDIIESLTIKTVHSACLQLLKMYGDKIGYPSYLQLTVIDETDSRMLIDMAAEHLGYFNASLDQWKESLSRGKVSALMEAYYAAENITKMPPKAQRAAEAVMGRYHSHCRMLGVLDYGMILRQTRDLFAEHPDVLAKYAETLQHVLVDEIQDSSSVEFSLYESLCPPATLFVVGDLRQSIYGFRYARPDILRDMVIAKDDREFVVCDLEKSFRCDRNIIEAANRLISHNKDALAKPAVSATGNLGRVAVRYGPYRAVVDAARELRTGYYLRSSSVQWGDIAVLARTHRVLRKLWHLFNDAGIPAYRVGADEGFMQGQVFRELSACIRLGVNRRDDVACLRLAGTRFGLSSYKLSGIQVNATQSRNSLFEAIVKEGRDKPGWDDSLQQAIEEFTPTWSAISVIATLKEKLSRHYEEDELDPVLSWLRYHVYQLFDSPCDYPSLADLADWLGSYTPDRGEDAKRGRGKMVTLITAHAAKGLEWPCVIVAALNEGVWPIRQSLDDEALVAEERRLLYVAVTRAKNACLLHTERFEDQPEGSRKMDHSRFLDEMFANRQAPKTALAPILD